MMDLQIHQLIELYTWWVIMTNKVSNIGYTETPTDFLGSHSCIYHNRTWLFVSKGRISSKAPYLELSKQCHEDPHIARAWSITKPNQWHQPSGKAAPLVDYAITELDEAEFMIDPLSKPRRATGNWHDSIFFYKSSRSTK